MWQSEQFHHCIYCRIHLSNDSLHRTLFKLKEYTIKLLLKRAISHLLLLFVLTIGGRMEIIMIKFISLDSEADAEDLMNSVNRYILTKHDCNSETFNLYLPGMLQNMMHAVEAANCTYKIDTNQSLDSSNKVKRLSKKILSKMIRWYLNLIVNQQVTFNSNMVRSINEEIEIIKILVDRNMDQEYQIEKLILRIQSLEKNEVTKNE